MLRLDLIRIMQRQTAASGALTKPNLPSAQQALGAMKKPPGSALAKASRIISQIYGGGGEQSLLLNRFRWSTDRRAAAIALAVRLYQLDHNGAWPDTLDQLVPRYLPFVPVDPMAANDARFGYRGAPATQPFTYSVGEDGTDDGGSTRPSRASWDPIDPWTTRDTVYHLTRQPRQIEDSETAEDHPRDPNNGGGNSK